MFSLIEALNFRCLRDLQAPLEGFHVLVGPNASGKTTFLDVISFLSDLVRLGLDRAIEERTSNLRDMFSNHAGDRFELAVEAKIPEERNALLRDRDFRSFRYEVVVGIDPESAENRIFYEIGSLRKSQPMPRPSEHGLFPEIRPLRETLLQPSKPRNSRIVFSKKPGQHDNFYPETRDDAGSSGWVPAFQLGPRKSTLANLPEDETRFPVATWFKRLLAEGVQKLVLNSLSIRRASPPGQARGFKPDGSNLPWVISAIEGAAPGRLADWIAHVRSALPDLKTVITRERPDDRHRYLVIQYGQGLVVPSWMASDGTLRLLALTLPAYLPDLSGVYLVEEPENGIHPRAVETVFQSLSSVYGAQILMATHSPVVLSMVEANKVLCFAKTPEGSTDIVRGDRHPRLRAWKGEENLGVFFAAGVLS